jgi:hypothetical protein
MTERRFPPPWSIVELTERFVTYSPNDGRDVVCNVAADVAAGGFGELLTGMLDGLR